MHGSSILDCTCKLKGNMCSIDNQDFQFLRQRSDVTVIGNHMQTAVGTRVSVASRQFSLLACVQIIGRFYLFLVIWNEFISMYTLHVMSEEQARKVSG